MNELNQTLTIKTGYNSLENVINDIENIYAKYLSIYKKSSKSKLVYSFYGNKQISNHNLAIWFNESCENEVENYKSIIQENNF